MGFRTMLLRLLTGRCTGQCLDLPTQLGIRIRERRRPVRSFCQTIVSLQFRVESVPYWVGHTLKASPLPVKSISRRGLAGDTSNTAALAWTYKLPLRQGRRSHR